MTTTRDILVWGAGAIGGTVGAYLARQGLDVTFTDVVPEHIEAIADPARGLHISGPIADFSVSAPAFAPHHLNGRWKRIFLAVKAQHTEAATKALLPFLDDSGYVLSLQNGLCEKTIERFVGTQRTIGAFVNFGADWLGPGEIAYGNRAAFVIGELNGSITPRLRALHADLSQFEPDAEISTNVWSYLWGKLAYSSLLIAQAIGEKGIADCLDREELLPLWRALAGEIIAVAGAEGVEVKGFNGFSVDAFGQRSSEDAARSSVRAMVAFNRPNAKTHSGVWRDLAVRKRKTEVDSLLGEVVRIGARHNLACPKTAALVRMIGEIEAGLRDQADANLEELLRV